MNHGRGDAHRSASVYYEYALTGIVETDHQWSILRGNAAAASITGRERKRLPGLRLPELAAHESSAYLEQHLQLIAEQGIGQTSWQLRRDDGTEITVDCESIQVSDDLFIHIFDDVTLQRRAAAELESARAAAEAANRAKSAFLASISHEIRTPMNGILGLGQLALTTSLDAEQREYVEKMVQSGRTLLKVLNELLDYGKLESGKMRFELIDFNLDELLEELATVVAQVPPDSPLEVVFDIAPEVTRALVGDRLRIGQILTNLLSNALKFTLTGSVVLAVTAQPGDDEVIVRFSVSDTGIGMTECAMSRMFEPFSQAEEATTRRFGGTGLGLAIARELTAGLGGELFAESEPGVGTRMTVVVPFGMSRQAMNTGAAGAEVGSCFVVAERAATRQAVENLLEAEGIEIARSPSVADFVIADMADGPVGTAVNLPVARAVIAMGHERRELGPQFADGDLPIARVSRPLTPRSLRRVLRTLELVDEIEDLDSLVDVPLDFVGVSVLVVDDVEVNRLVLANLLRKAGIDVLEAADGPQVLEMLGSRADGPALVLMDVHMPNLDGLAATRSLRSSGLTLPIIGVSASASPEEEQACLDAGMNDFLPKPVDADELWGCLTRWITPKAQRYAHAQPVDAEQRFLGDKQALSRARKVFVDSHANDTQALTAAWLDGDMHRALHLAHRLKGAAAVVGADEVVSMAGELERGAQDSDVELSEVHAVLERLEVVLTRLCQ